MPKRKGPYLIQSNNKIIPGFITKPEQGMKSIEFSELIHKDLTEHPNTLSFYICPNRRNQANQADENFMKYNNYYRQDKHRISVLHGEKQCSKDADGYILRAIENGEKMIIALANKTRMQVVKNIIIKWIKRNPLNKVKIYLDEAADSKTMNCFINHVWKDLEENIGSLTNIFPIFIDAHTKALLNNKNFINYFPSETIYKLENKYNLTNYMFISSMNYIPHEFNDSSDILNAIHQELIVIKQNDYILWPLPKVKAYQYEDAQEIIYNIQLDCCVLNINGDGFHVYLKINGECLPKITLPKTSCKENKFCGQITCKKCANISGSELEQIKRIKQTYATNIPLILAGHDCINRAMTYHEPGFSFTKAFIARHNLLLDPFSPGLCDKSFEELSDGRQEQISQMIKRLSGSFRDSYENDSRLPLILCPQDIYDGIVNLEVISEHISKQNGYLTRDTRNRMDEFSPDITLLTEDEMERLNIEREPYHYYMVTFNYIGNDEVIKDELSNFRHSIGGARVQLRTVSTRKNGIEPDQNLGLLKLDTFKSDMGLLKLSLNEETQSRIRVCKDQNDEIKFIITFQMKRNTFQWNNNEYKIIPLEKDGNCLFNSVIQSKLIESLDDINRMRRNIRSELVKNKSIYDLSNNYTEDEWDDDCDKIKVKNAWTDSIFDYCIYAISNLYKINIHIFETQQLSNGGYEFKRFHSLSDTNEHPKDIYLMRSNDNHYDLMTQM